MGQMSTSLFCSILSSRKSGMRGVGAQGHVAAVALDGADADEDGIVSAEIFLCLGPRSGWINAWYYLLVFLRSAVRSGWLQSG